MQWLGDTPHKGGGKLTLPIWLRYPRFGLLITFATTTWEDYQSPISFITVFKREADEPYCGVCLKKEAKLRCKGCRRVDFCSEKCELNFMKIHKCKWFLTTVNCYWLNSNRFDVQENTACNLKLSPISLSEMGLVSRKKKVAGLTSGSALPASL